MVRKVCGGGPAHSVRGPTIKYEPDGKVFLVDKENAHLRSPVKDVHDHSAAVQFHDKINEYISVPESRIDIGLTAFRVLDIFVFQQYISVRFSSKRLSFLIQ